MLISGAVLTWPAIWRETIEHIHAGMPQRPLPMIEPQPPALEPPSTGERLPEPSRPGTGLGEAIRDLIGGVLGN